MISTSMNNINYPANELALYKKASLQFAQQRDFLALTASLLNTLRQIDSVISADVYEVHNLNKHEQQSSGFEEFQIYKYSLQENHFAAIDNYCEEAQLINPADVSAAEKISQTNNRIITLPSYVGTNRVLLIRHETAPNHEKEYMDYLVSLYENISTLVESNEHDTLTGLLNRKTFNNRIISIIKSCHGDTRREGDQDMYSWLAVLDIDHFKKINDTYGHLYGDEILLLFSQILQKTFRSDDLLFRYGGEEFIVILRAENKNSATIALERFRKILGDYKFPKGKRVTVSIGYVLIRTGILPSTLIDEADKALYQAKSKGRNRVLQFDDTAPATNHIEQDVEFF